VKIARFEGELKFQFLFFSGKPKNVYDSDNENSEITKKSTMNWWRKSILFLISLPVRKYPYLHKIDNLCIDFKRKTVKYEQDQKRCNILTTKSGKSEKYLIDEETVEKFCEIIAKRHSREENVKQKVESLQSEVKKLKISLKNQHEEMKKLIQELISARKTE
jgi:hypothetical protein